MNVDRSFRNTNMLWWHKELWLIDHGAALYFHHSWDNWQQQANRSFAHIKDHVLLPRATEMETADKQFRSILTNELITEIIQLIPEEWLVTGSPFATVEDHRQAYTEFLTRRIGQPNLFINAASYAG
jgi:hypothetical protein